MKTLFLKSTLYFIFFISSALMTVSAQQTENDFTEAQLAQMLAPIALYPDSLLTHILIASTYPIEIIEAHRWVEKNSNVDTNQVAIEIEGIDWEPSVKALVPFPRILKRMSDNLTWTRQLGDAFLQDEARLLAEIQVLRKKAELAGSFDEMENMNVSYEDDNIIIQPTQPEIVYVPYYDTRMVYGSWYWPAYPPTYWAPRFNISLTHYSPFYWHSGVHISFNYFFSAFHWHNRHVVVIDHHYSNHYRQRRLIVSGHYATTNRWTHNPYHRKGVAYRSNVTKNRYYSKRPSVQQTKNRRVSERVLLSNNHRVNSNQSRKILSKSENSKMRVFTQHQKLQNKISKQTKNVRASSSYKNNASKVKSLKNNLKRDGKYDRGNVNTSTENRNVKQSASQQATHKRSFKEQAQVKVKQKYSPVKSQKAVKKVKNYTKKSEYRSKSKVRSSSHSSSKASRSSTKSRNNHSYQRK